MNKKKLYEIYLLIHSYANDETNSTTVKDIYSSISIKEDVSMKEVGRFDIKHDKKVIKASAICFNVVIENDHENKIKTIQNKIKSNTTIAKYIIVRLKKDQNNYIDHKNPITTKKYMFESSRIMPKELTKFKGKNQKRLAKHTKRQKSLGLIVRKIN